VWLSCGVSLLFILALGIRGLLTVSGEKSEQNPRICPQRVTDKARKTAYDG
jgi:hypothetical protein